MSADNLPKLLRETFPEQDSFGPVTGSQRALAHYAAKTIERQQRQIEALHKLAISKAEELNGCGAHRYDVMGDIYTKLQEIEAME